MSKRKNKRKNKNNIVVANESPAEIKTETKAEINIRRKRNLFFGIRAVVFFILVLCLMSYATYVLTPKYEYGICSMVNFYEQPKDSIDVLAVGTSVFYTGINTNVLWGEYGISCYNLCSAEQPYYISYYVIKEALKTQRPKVILLDVQPSVYTADYSKRVRVILSTYGIKSLDNRIGAILSSVEKPMDSLGYIMGLPEVHNNYENLTETDFIFPTANGGRDSNWKGYIEQENTKAVDIPVFSLNDEKCKINARQEEYARKIFELCKEEGIELLLVGVPTPTYTKKRAYFNTLWSIASEYGYSGINYNNPKVYSEVSYSTHFADYQHLNIKGSISFSKKLGVDLLEKYNLTDHRGDEYYSSYDECADSWYEKYPDYATEENK